ncbi:hypothetical protein DXG01_000763 [Tephrocybe rancida]|nr:hypothetical protein DXG01_000763 [Tephrocybe rancida]
MSSYTRRFPTPPPGVRTIYNYNQPIVSADPPKVPPLELPSSLSALNLDLGRLWLTRTVKKPEQPKPRVVEEEPRARTPVFTRPPPGLVMKPSVLPSPTFTFGKPRYLLECVAEMQSSMSIQLPNLLPFALKLPGFDWDDQPSVLFSPMNDAGTLKKRRAGRDNRQLSPLLPSPQRPLLVSDTEGDSSPSNEGLMDVDDADESDDDNPRWPCYAFLEEARHEDVAYFGDEEDNRMIRRPRSTRTPVDSFTWLEGELEDLFWGIPRGKLIDPPGSFAADIIASQGF